MTFRDDSVMINDTMISQIIDIQNFTCRSSTIELTMDCSIHLQASFNFECETIKIHNDVLDSFGFADHISVKADFVDSLISIPSHSLTLQSGTTLDFEITQFASLLSDTYYVCYHNGQAQSQDKCPGYIDSSYIPDIGSLCQPKFDTCHIYLVDSIVVKQARQINQNVVFDAIIAGLNVELHSESVFITSPGSIKLALELPDITFRSTNVHVTGDTISLAPYPTQSHGSMALSLTAEKQLSITGDQSEWDAVFSEEIELSVNTPTLNCNETLTFPFSLHVTSVITFVSPIGSFSKLIFAENDQSLVLDEGGRRISYIDTEHCDDVSFITVDNTIVECRSQTNDVQFVLTNKHTQEVNISTDIGHIDMALSVFKQEYQSRIVLTTQQVSAREIYWLSKSGRLTFDTFKIEDEPTFTDYKITFVAADEIIFEGQPAELASMNMGKITVSTDSLIIPRFSSEVHSLLFYHVPFGHAHSTLAITPARALEIISVDTSVELFLYDNNLISTIVQAESKSRFYVDSNPPTAFNVVNTYKIVIINNNVIVHFNEHCPDTDPTIPFSYDTFNVPTSIVFAYNTLLVIPDGQALTMSSDLKFEFDGSCDIDTYFGLQSYSFEFAPISITLISQGCIALVNSDWKGFDYIDKVSITSRYIDAAKDIPLMSDQWKFVSSDEFTTIALSDYVLKCVDNTEHLTMGDSSPFDYYIVLTTVNELMVANMLNMSGNLIGTIDGDYQFRIKNGERLVVAVTAPHLSPSESATTGNPTVTFYDDCFVVAACDGDVTVDMVCAQKSFVITEVSDIGILVKTESAIQISTLLTIDTIAFTIASDNNVKVANDLPQSYIEMITFDTPILSAPTAVEFNSQVIVDLGRRNLSISPAHWTLNLVWKAVSWTGEHYLILSDLSSLNAINIVNMQLIFEQSTFHIKGPTILKLTPNQGYPIQIVTEQNGALVNYSRPDKTADVMLMFDKGSIFVSSFDDTGESEFIIHQDGQDFIFHFSQPTLSIIGYEYAESNWQSTNKFIFEAKDRISLNVAKWTSNFMAVPVLISPQIDISEFEPCYKASPSGEPILSTKDDLIDDTLYGFFGEVHAKSPYPNIQSIVVTDLSINHYRAMFCLFIDPFITIVESKSLTFYDNTNLQSITISDDWKCDLSFLNANTSPDLPIRTRAIRFASCGVDTTFELDTPIDFLLLDTVSDGNEYLFSQRSLTFLSADGASRMSLNFGANTNIDEFYLKSKELVLKCDSSLTQGNPINCVVHANVIHIESTDWTTVGPFEFLTPELTTSRLQSCAFQNLNGKILRTNTETRCYNAECVDEAALGSITVSPVHILANLDSTFSESSGAKIILKNDLFLDGLLIYSGGLIKLVIGEAEVALECQFELTLEKTQYLTFVGGTVERFETNGENIVFGTRAMLVKPDSQCVFTRNKYSLEFDFAESIAIAFDNTETPREIFSGSPYSFKITAPNVAFTTDGETLECTADYFVSCNTDETTTGLTICTDEVSVSSIYTKLSAFYFYLVPLHNSITISPIYFVINCDLSKNEAKLEFSNSNVNMDVDMDLIFNDNGIQIEFTSLHLPKPLYDIPAIQFLFTNQESSNLLVIKTPIDVVEIDGRNYHFVINDCDVDIDFNGAGKTIFWSFTSAVTFQGSKTAGRAALLGEGHDFTFHSPDKITIDQSITNGIDQMTFITPGLAGSAHMDDPDAKFIVATDSVVTTTLITPMSFIVHLDLSSYGGDTLTLDDYTDLSTIDLDNNQQFRLYFATLDVTYVIEKLEFSIVMSLTASIQSTLCVNLAASILAFGTHCIEVASAQAPSLFFQSRNQCPSIEFHVKGECTMVHSPGEPSTTSHNLKILVSAPDSLTIAGISNSFDWLDEMCVASEQLIQSAAVTTTKKIFVVANDQSNNIKITRADLIEHLSFEQYSDPSNLILTVEGRKASAVTFNTTGIHFATDQTEFSLAVECQSITLHFTAITEQIHTSAAVFTLSTTCAMFSTHGTPITISYAESASVNWYFTNPSVRFDLSGKTYQQGSIPESTFHSERFDINPAGVSSFSTTLHLVTNHIAALSALPDNLGISISGRLDESAPVVINPSDLLNCMTMNGIPLEVIDGNDLTRISYGDDIELTFASSSFTVPPSANIIAFHLSSFTAPQFVVELADDSPLTLLANGVGLVKTTRREIIFGESATANEIVFKSATSLTLASTASTQSTIYKKPVFSSPAIQLEMLQWPWKSQYKSANDVQATFVTHSISTTGIDITGIFSLQTAIMVSFLESDTVNTLDVTPAFLLASLDVSTLPGCTLITRDSTGFSGLTFTSKDLAFHFGKLTSPPFVQSFDISMRVNDKSISSFDLRAETSDLEFIDRHVVLPKLDLEISASVQLNIHITSNKVQIKSHHSASHLLDETQPPVFISGARAVLDITDWSSFGHMNLAVLSMEAISAWPQSFRPTVIGYAGAVTTLVPMTLANSVDLSSYLGTTLHLKQTGDSQYLKLTADTIQIDKADPISFFCNIKIIMDNLSAVSGKEPFAIDIRTGFDCDVFSMHQEYVKIAFSNTFSVELWYDLQHSNNALTVKSLTGKMELNDLLLTKPADSAMVLNVYSSEVVFHVLNNDKATPSLYSAINIYSNRITAEYVIDKFYTKANVVAHNLDPNTACVVDPIDLEKVIDVSGIGQIHFVTPLPTMTTLPERHSYVESMSAISTYSLSLSAVEHYSHTVVGYTETAFAISVTTPIGDQIVWVVSNTASERYEIVETVPSYSLVGVFVRSLTHDMVLIVSIQTVPRDKLSNRFIIALALGGATILAIILGVVYWLVRRGKDASSDSHDVLCETMIGEDNSTTFATVGYEGEVKRNVQIEDDAWI